MTKEILRDLWERFKEFMAGGSTISATIENPEKTEKKGKRKIHISSDVYRISVQNSCEIITNAIYYADDTTLNNGEIYCLLKSLILEKKLLSLLTKKLTSKLQRETTVTEQRRKICQQKN